MIVDTSAVAALIFGQSESSAIASALLAGAPSAIGAPTLAEAAIVLQSRLGTQGLTHLRGFLVEFDVHAVPFGDEHWRQAGLAFAHYGKGRHPAGLNFGDCLTYAVAKVSGMPLLCVGGDFALTDLELVPLAG